MYSYLSKGDCLQSDNILYNVSVGRDNLANKLVGGQELCIVQWEQPFSLGGLTVKKMDAELLMLLSFM